MKKFEDVIKELLQNKGLNQENADLLVSSRNEHMKILNDENKTLRQEKEDLSKNYDEVLKSKSDLDTQLSDLDQKIAKAKQDGRTEIADQLEAEKVSKVELQKSLDNLTNANQKLTLDGIVNKAFGVFDVEDSHKNTTNFMLRSRVKMNDKNEAVYVDGNTESSVEDGFKAYFEANPKQIKSDGGDGGSGAGNTGGGHTIDTSKLSPSQMMAQGRKEK